MIMENTTPKNIEELNEEHLQKKGYEIICKPARDLLKKEGIKHIKILKLKSRKICSNNGNLPYRPTSEEWIKVEQKTTEIHLLMWLFSIKEKDIK